MIVCSCRGVNDRRISAAIDAGAGTIRDIALRCGAGSRCGGCWPALQELLERHTPAPAPAPLVAAGGRRTA